MSHGKTAMTTTGIMMIGTNTMTSSGTIMVAEEVQVETVMAEIMIQVVMKVRIFQTNFALLPYLPNILKQTRMVHPRILLMIPMQKINVHSDLWEYLWMLTQY